VLIPVRCLSADKLFKICAPRRSGLHLDNVDYDNALAAGQQLERSLHVREEWGDRWVIRRKIRQRHILGS